MELNRLIPLKFISHIGCNWVVKGNYLMYRRYEHIPVAYMDGDVVYIFLENKIPNQILKLTKWVIGLGVEFYFADPEFSNPVGMDDYHRETIQHYLYSYSRDHFFDGFRKIDFDLIKNMTDWCSKEGCVNLIRDVYHQINNKIQKPKYEYFSNSYEYEVRKDIRETFMSIYRDIQINQII